MPNLNSLDLEPLVNTIFVFMVASFVKLVCKRIFKHIKDEKMAYKAFSFTRIILNIILSILIIIIWWDYVEHIMTLISFLSAAFAIAIRDIILNWFCGLYIKIHRPFKIEDRIEVKGIKGDVLDISVLSFDILEVSNKDDFGQSTGVIINMPNSCIFDGPIKNLTKTFKYVWNEIDVKIGLYEDVNATKKVLYKIINEIDDIKSIPKKMKNIISDISTSYRIYYNNYDPIIYTKIEDSHVTLTLRYLVHPKKARTIMSTIYNKIYEANKNEEIVLYKDSE